MLKPLKGDFTMKFDPRFNGRYVPGAGGTRLFVEEIGDRSNPTILWLHGYCQCRLAWDRQFEDNDLAARFHMVRIDLRGHGLSDKPTDPAAFRNSQNWADDVHAVSTALQLQKPVLAGWSYGGYIICDYIRHYGQDNVGGIVFVAAATEMGRAAANAMLGQEFLQLVPGFFSSDYAEGSAALQRLIELVPYEQFDAHTFYFLMGCNTVTLPASRIGMFTRELDNRELMQSITVPTLIVQGNNDCIVLPSFADHIARYIPHAQCASYDRCGHAPFSEAPQQFNRDMTAFMQHIHDQTGGL
jgi:non-heme chloroperoxidase